MTEFATRAVHAGLDPDPSYGSVVPASPDVVQNAFRELHGPRLHGFALLLTLGDRPRAANE